MAEFFTWSDIRTKIQNDLGVADEVFVTETELKAYANEAIREAEAEIHDLYEDYFLSSATLTLVQDQSLYALPTGIYAHKIRRIIYQFNSTIYTIERLRDWRKFEQKAVIDYYGNSTTDFYNYFITNTTPGSPQINLVPKARVSGPYVTIWFIRDANVLVNDTDVCDIPEFVNFILQYMKVRVYEKEQNPNLQQAIAVLQQQRELMQGTLAQMVPDADTALEMDLSFYKEHS